MCFLLSANDVRLRYECTHSKPISPSELYATVAEWCRSKVSHLTTVATTNQLNEEEQMLRIEGVDTRKVLLARWGDKQLYFKLLRLFVQDQRGVIGFLFGRL